MAQNWNSIADALEMVARLRHAEWKCGFPPFDTLPNSELDEVVSDWCRMMGGNLAAPIDPPEEVKPWILARLVTASVQARIEADAGTEAPEFSPETARNMLIESWEDLLRDYWNLMVTLDLDSW